MADITNSWGVDVFTTTDPEEVPTTTANANNNSGGFWGGVYDDFLKPWGQKELGVSNAEEVKKQAYQEATQQAQAEANKPLINGISNTNLLFVGIGAVSLFLIVRD